MRLMLQRQKLVARTLLINRIWVKVSMKSWRIFSQVQTQNLNLKQGIKNLSVFLETTYWKFFGFSHPFNERTIPLIDPNRKSFIKGFNGMVLPSTLRVICSSFFDFKNFFSIKSATPLMSSRKKQETPTSNSLSETMTTRLSSFVQRRSLFFSVLNISIFGCTSFLYPSERMRSTFWIRF